MASANDLRLVQVRSVYLCVYMGDSFFRGFTVCSGTREPRAHDKHQLELRREETRAIHEFVQILHH